MRDKQGHQVSEQRGGTCSQPAPDCTLLPDYQPGGEGRGSPGRSPAPPGAVESEGCHSFVLWGRQMSPEDGVDGQGSQSHPEAL